MRGAPLCVLRVVIETSSGARSTGYASDLLVPKWFEKVSEQSIDADWVRLIEGISWACDAVTASQTPATVFDHWDRLDTERVMGWQGDRSTRLMLGQSVSIVERAMLDAVCRANGQPLHQALRSGATGFHGSRLGAIGSLEEVVRREPLTQIAIRHTVGLLDAIESNSQPFDASDDGFPVSPDAWVPISTCCDPSSRSSLPVVSKSRPNSHSCLLRSLPGEVKKN